MVYRQKNYKPFIEPIMTQFYVIYNMSEWPDPGEVKTFDL